MAKTNSPYEQHILTAARKNPEELTTVNSFASFIRRTSKLDVAQTTMREHINKVAEAHKLKFTPDVANDVANDIARYRDKASEKKFQRQYTELLDRYTNLEEAYNDLLFVEGQTVKVTSMPKLRTAKALKGQAVPIMQWSDWHVEKRIDRDVMNGLNEFTPEIAKARALTLFQNNARMVEIYGQTSIVTQGVLHLGGDFIEGYLRDSNLRMNHLSPIEAVPFAAELIITGIQYLLDNTKLEILHLLCSRGNHPRLTPKMDSDDHKMNLETLIYHMVIKHFVGEERVVAHFSPSDISYFDIMGKRIRYIHGHQIKYNGGIGGLAIPMRKAILSWDQTDQADETLGCHFHTSYKPLQNYMQNGSLCGYDPYAMSVVKAPFQAPMQSMELLVEGRGFRMFTSIDCE